MAETRKEPEPARLESAREDNQALLTRMAQLEKEKTERTKLRHQRLAELNALRTDQLYKMMMISGYYHLVNERLPGEMEETLSKSENIPDGALSTCNSAEELLWKLAVKNLGDDNAYRSNTLITLMRITERGGLYVETRRTQLWNDRVAELERIEIHKLSKMLLVSGYHHLVNEPGAFKGEEAEIASILQKLPDDDELDKYTASEELLATLRNLVEEHYSGRPDNMLPLGSSLMPHHSPLDHDQVVNTSIEEFNDLLDTFTLHEEGQPPRHFTEEEKNFFRDTRRKGKNRQAASRSRDRRNQLGLRLRVDGTQG